MEIKEIIKKIKSQKDKKFDESIDLILSVGLGKGAEAGLRMDINIPNKFGSDKKVLVLCDKNEVSQASKADYAGLEEYVEKIKEGWREFDVVIATPTVMPKIAILGKFLGSSGMMPNPKNGTVTKDVESAVNEFKSGKQNIKSNKSGQIQLAVAKKSMDAAKIEENVDYVVKAINEGAMKVVGITIKSTFIKSSMGTPYRLN